MLIWRQELNENRPRSPIYRVCVLEYSNFGRSPFWDLSLFGGFYFVIFLTDGSSEMVFFLF